MREEDLERNFTRRHLVFISSNFREFEELRRKLRDEINSWPGCPMEAKDLNDNEPGSRPPLDVSLVYARRCEVMVVLIGNSYGGKPPGRDKSYTHLECIEAWTDGNPRVLPFFMVGGPPSEQSSEDDRMLLEWKAEIEKHHRRQMLDFSKAHHELAKNILGFVTREIYNRLNEKEQQAVNEIDNFDEQLGDLEISGLSDEDLQRLERKAGIEADSLFRDTKDCLENPIDALNRPSEAAALEQRREAKKAIAIGDRPTAIKHLEKALELRPLDEIACLQLAKVLASRGIKGDLRRASVLSVKAANMARYDKRQARAASAFALASQMCLEAGDVEDARLRAEESIDVAGWLAAPHLQLARFLESPN